MAIQIVAIAKEWIIEPCENDAGKQSWFQENNAKKGVNCAKCEPNVNTKSGEKLFGNGWWQNFQTTIESQNLWKRNILYDQNEPDKLFIIKYLYTPDRHCFLHSKKLKSKKFNIIYYIYLAKSITK